MVSRSVSRCIVYVLHHKVLPEFVYFAVEICHRATLPGATLNFPASKNFANRPKHQTRRRAWVGQADFRKVELNNRNHSGNCQPLSVKHETRSTKFSIRVLSPWIEVGIFILRRKCKVITVIARNTNSIFPFTTLCKNTWLNKTLMYLVSGQLHFSMCQTPTFTSN